MEMVGGAESFEGGDRRANKLANRYVAGADRDTVTEDGAGTAPSEAAAVLRGVQSQLVAQDIEEGSVECRLNRVRAAVDLDVG
jgi:hypothetical protein